MQHVLYEFEIVNCVASRQSKRSRSPHVSSHDLSEHLLFYPTIFETEIIEDGAEIIY